jgi:hypothetical protein
MGQLPQPSAQESLLYLFPNGQTQEVQLPSWMAATIIEDDDLMFGGKSLSTWYEEDRRRYSMGDESCSSPSADEEEEEEQPRGRQRVSFSTLLSPRKLLESLCV